MNFNSSYLIDSKRANRIKLGLKKNDNKFLVVGKKSCMNVLWAFIMLFLGAIITLIGVQGWNGKIGNYIGVILGSFLLLIGIYMLKSKKSNYVLIKDGFLLIKPATDNSFYIPIRNIMSIGIKNNQNRVTEWSDIGSNSAKSAINEYKIFIKTDEIDVIDISFDFSGIKMSDLSHFLFDHNLI